MKKIWSLLRHRIVWTTGGALLAMVVVPAIVALVLKALGLVHGASLHTWLLDIGQNMGSGGAAGAFGAGAAGGAGGPSGGSDGGPSGGSGGDPDWPGHPGYGPFHWPDRDFPEPHNLPHSVSSNPPDRWSRDILLWIGWSIQQAGGSSETNKANGCTKA